MKMVSCGHQGERDVARHAESTQYLKNVKAMKNVQPLSFASATDPLKDKVGILIPYHASNRLYLFVRNLLSQLILFLYRLQEQR